MRKFEHDLALLYRVIGKIDRAHTALAELLHNRVVIDLCTWLQSHTAILSDV